MTQTLTTERQQFEEYFNDFYGCHPTDHHDPIHVEGIWHAWQDGNTRAANREAQPVAGGSLECEDELNAALQLHRLKVEGHSQLSDAFRAGFKYARRTAPPAPAVPEDYQHLKNVRELYHKQEDRLFSLAQLINGPSFDKYSQSVDQAISVLEREIFSDDGDTCRAAMLAAAPEGN